MYTGRAYIPSGLEDMSFHNKVPYTGYALSYGLIYVSGSDFLRRKICFVNDKLFCGSAVSIISTGVNVRTWPMG